MRVRIASRKSDLARIQAISVGQALVRAHSGLQVEFQFRESLGDLNQSDPLWKMPEKGVFTEDFYQDLVQGRCDLVVHSWKDLPTETRPDTEILATLPRADSRDLLLVRKDRWNRIAESGAIRIFTSSPRRSHNLEPFLRSYLPARIRSVGFEAVRGNIPTRLKKTLSSEIDGIVVAKAALDRVLGTTEAEFAESRETVRDALKRCLWCILPLSLNPSAPAQGALAIEARRDRPDLRELLAPIHCHKTFEDVQLERSIFASLCDGGGGCHQKIGVSVLSRDYGQVLFQRGLSPDGRDLSLAKLIRDKAPPKKVPRARAWPLDPADSRFFERKRLDVAVPDPEIALWIARSEALPEAWRLGAPGERIFDRILWTSGLSTWQALARRGHWIHGTADSLGETEEPGISTLLGGEPRWLKLSHARTEEIGLHETLGTYELIPSPSAPDLRRNLGGKTHFYWMSASSFDRACELEPSIREGHHACGPGNTFRLLSQRVLDQNRLEIFLSWEEWLKETVHD